MHERITKTNWASRVDAALQLLLDAAASCSPGSLEERTLLLERQSLREMRDQVRERSPGDRTLVDSPLISASARETLSVPDDLVDEVGRLYEVYRRWRSDLVWSS